MILERKRIDSIFQSTLPARGATMQPSMLNSALTYFNPRSPHGERLSASDVALLSGRFQSTLPARGATTERRERPACTGFQSTLPARGATVDDYHGWMLYLHFNPRSPHGERLHTSAHLRANSKISIHAPRTGSDATKPVALLCALRFQSTLPARGATGVSVGVVQNVAFQSTLPARGATLFGCF